jgi:hypothetical protein
MIYGLTNEKLVEMRRLCIFNKWKEQV